MNVDPMRFAGRLGASLRRRLRIRRRQREQSDLIANSPLFDAHWYLETYPDVAAARANPALHFLENGWLEGRDPGPEFATSAYLRANPDVARAGLNPLLHFIEFGQSEGREVRAHRFPPWRHSARKWNFAAAAPVFRGRAGCEPTAPWLSSYRLSEDDPRLFSIGEWKVGYIGSGKRRSAVESAFALLSHLSGYGEKNGGKAFESDTPAPSLTDSWYVNDACLRTRWGGRRFPFVVRAFQHDPLRGGELALVADEIVNSPIDFVDFALEDPYSPLLVLFAEPEGTLAGIRLLAFPSYCRGGLHYPELLAVSAEGCPPDPMTSGLEQARRLIAARDDPKRLVQSIEVDPAGADGISPMFQPRFRNWLERVAKVQVGHAKSGGRLVFAADMIPTISVLAECGDGGSGAQSAFHPLLVANPDPSQPSLLVQLPANAPECVARAARGYPAPWPRSLGAAASDAGLSGPAAIRLHRREPSDAELLIPAAGEPEPRESGEPATITWLIGQGGEPADLLESVRAISLQSGPFTHSIGSVGQPGHAGMDDAAGLFRGRTRSYPDLRAAVRSLDTDFVAYIAPGVVLHDNHATELLLSLLGDPAVESVSCALVSSEKRGKSWQVSIVDPGELLPRKDQSPAVYRDQVSRLWRASYPVVQPSRDLWFARTSKAKAWLGRNGSPELETGVHLCTTLVTASYSKPRAKKSKAIPIPKTANGRSTAVRLLFG